MTNLGVPAHSRLRAGLLALVWVHAVFAAEAPSEGHGASNPLGRRQEAVRAGDAIFHERCAVCHGRKAAGGMAANLLRARSVARGSDKALFALIQKGIRGTEMPPQPDLSDESLWRIVSYLHSLARPGEQPPVEGDVEAGRVVFRQAGCVSCHIVDGAGGFLGPELDSIAIRATSEEIRREVLQPSAHLAPGFQTVAVETISGRRLSGVLKNEDAFSLQMLTRDGEFALFERGELRAVDKPSRSLMPENIGEQLSNEQLRNLMAFLDRQRDPFIAVDRGFGNY